MTFIRMLGFEFFFGRGFLCLVVDVMEERKWLVSVERRPIWVSIRVDGVVWEYIMLLSFCCVCY